jgi:hypothetical protein
MHGKIGFDYEAVVVASHGEAPAIGYPISLPPIFQAQNKLPPYHLLHTMRPGRFKSIITGKQLVEFKVFFAAL